MYMSLSFFSLTALTLLCHICEQCVHNYIYIYIYIYIFMTMSASELNICNFNPLRIIISLDHETKILEFCLVHLRFVPSCAMERM